MNLLLTLLSLNFIIMPNLITVGNELIRINPSNNRIECSTNQGRTWNARYTGSYCGEFTDLLLYGTEIIAATDKGVYCSTNGGRTWNARYTGSYCGTFLSLADGGKELLAQTSKGLYYSTNSGRTWNRRS